MLTEYFINKFKIIIKKKNIFATQKFKIAYDINSTLSIK